MNELDGVAHLRRNGEELLEVQLLAVIRHINDALGIIVRYAALYACQIARRVIEAAV